MSNVILTLGGVPFQDMEVPEKISFGGKQRLSVQNLIGGGRVIEALGLDDGEISFAGIFSGANAIARVQLLDAARATGASLPLVWNGFFYTVIIEEFSAEFRKTTMIPFSIKCMVISEPLASFAALLPTAANLIENDLAAAAGLSVQAGFSLDNVDGTSLSGVSALQNTLAATIGTSGTFLNSATSAVQGALDANAGVAAINQLNGTSSQLAALSGMSGYINRAATILATGLV